MSSNMQNVIIYIDQLHIALFKQKCLWIEITFYCSWILLLFVLYVYFLTKAPWLKIQHKFSSVSISIHLFSSFCNFLCLPCLSSQLKSLYKSFIAHTFHSWYFYCEKSFFCVTYVSLCLQLVSLYIKSILSNL